MHRNVYDALLIFLCKIMHDFFINAISDESNLFVNESENMQGFLADKFYPSGYF